MTQVKRGMPSPHLLITLMASHSLCLWQSSNSSIARPAPSSRIVLPSWHSSTMHCLEMTLEDPMT